MRLSFSMAVLATAPLANAEQGQPVEAPAIGIASPASAPAATHELSTTATSAPPGARRHDGFFLRLGLGQGWAGYGVSEESSDSTTEEFHSAPGVNFEALLGGTPLEGFVVGGGLLTFGSLADDAPDEDAIIVGMLQYYPDARRGWHLQATPGTVLILDETRPFLSGGIGHEWWVGANWSLGAFARYSYFWLSTELADPVSGDVVHKDRHFHFGTLAFVATLH